MNSNNSTRRNILAALGTGATVGLAGCNSILEPDNTDNEDSQTENQPAENKSTNQEQPNIEFRSVEDHNLSNVDPRSTEPETYGLAFSADAAEADVDLTIQLTNGIQTQTYEASTSDLQVINDQVSILNIPENLLVHGDTQISATFTGENQEGTLDTEISAQTPQAFPIDRRVEGEQASNFETPWSFAQHDLDREAAGQAHLEYVDNNVVRDFNPANYGNRIDQVSSSNGMQEVLNNAAHVAMDVELDQSMGTNQSGDTIGFTTSYVASEFSDLMDQDQLYTMVVTDPEDGTDGIYHWNEETGKLYFQGTTRVSDNQDNLVVEFNPEQIGETTYDRSTILGFEPGEVEGIDYENKSKSAVSALTSPSRTTLTNASTIGINDYAIETISQEHLFGDKDIQEALDAMASVNRVEEMVNYDINGEPVYESPPGDSLGDLDGAMYVGFVADEGDSLEDMTLFVTEDESVYREMTENSEPKSRQEIEEMAGLN